MLINNKDLLKIFILLLILAAAAFLRLYKIKDYLVFLGDQGRDVLIVKRIIIDHKFTLLGPTASVGGFYLGPFYYYLMVFPLWLAHFDPVGPAIMVALLGVATVLLLYFFTKNILGQKAALFTAFLYAVSPLAVKSSRFSWNPNTWPFFTLALFYTLYYGRLGKGRKWFFFAGLFLGICFQLHYLALLLAPLGILLVFEKNLKKWFFNCLIFAGGLIITLSPFLLFELRHGFGNIEAIFEFITRKQGALGFYPLSLLFAFLEISERLFANFLGLEKGFWIKIAVYFFLSYLIFLFFKNNEKQKLRNGILVILVWWVAGGLLLRLYQGTIYDYYYGYLYPVPAIGLGIILAALYKRKFFIFKFFTTGLLIFFIYSCILKQPIWRVPNKMVDQTQRIAQSIIEYSQGQPYNFALISSGNSDHAYRYFLEVAGRKPVPLENRVEEELFVVCEEAVCQPLGHPLWEIAAFGRAEIATELQDKVGIRIFKLIHHPDSFDWVGKPAPKGK